MDSDIELAQTCQPWHGHTCEHGHINMLENL